MDDRIEGVVCVTRQIQAHFIVKLRAREENRSQRVKSQGTPWHTQLVCLSLLPSVSSSNLCTVVTCPFRPHKHTFHSNLWCWYSAPCCLLCSVQFKWKASNTPDKIYTLYMATTQVKKVTNVTETWTYTNIGNFKVSFMLNHKDIRLPTVILLSIFELNTSLVHLLSVCNVLVYINVIYH